MCLICNKADFLIETIEALFSEADAQKLIYDLCREKTDDVTVVSLPESPEVVDVGFAFGNIISAVATRWAIKMRIDPHSFMRYMMDQVGHQYTKDITIKLFFKAHGRLPSSEELKNKMKDYES